MTGPIVLFGGQPVTVTELYEFRYGFPQERYVQEGFGATANLFVQRSAMEAVGLFDGSLRSGGDREFGLRLAHCGWPTQWAEDAVVRHPARRRMADLLQKTRRRAAGTVVLQRRSTDPARLLLESVWLLRPPVKAFAKILLEEQSVGLRQRLAMVGLVAVVRATAALTRVRVLFGATPPR